MYHPHFQGNVALFGTFFYLSLMKIISESLCSNMLKALYFPKSLHESNVFREISKMGEIHSKGYTACMSAHTSEYCI
jgi:hypothetical protein